MREFHHFTLFYTALLFFVCSSRVEISWCLLFFFFCSSCSVVLSIMDIFVCSWHRTKSSSVIRIRIMDNFLLSVVDECSKLTDLESLAHSPWLSSMKLQYWELRSEVWVVQYFILASVHHTIYICVKSTCVSTFVMCGVYEIVLLCNLYYGFHSVSALSHHRHGIQIFGPNWNIDMSLFVVSRPDV